MTARVVAAQRVVPLHQGRPAPVDEAADVGQGVRDGEPRRRVQRPLPVELGAVPGGRPSLAEDRVRAVRDRRRPDSRLPIAAGVEEARRPSVRTPTCGGCPCTRRRRSRRGRAGACLARGRRRQRLDAALGELGHEPPNREDDGRRARHVARGPRAASGRSPRRGSPRRPRPRRRPGTGSGATTTRAPSRSATWRRMLMIALYSWSSVRSSSPGSNRSERTTAFTAPVALATNARSSGSAPTNAPSVPRASASRPGRSRARNWTGRASRRSRQRAVPRGPRSRARAERPVIQERDRRVERPQGGEVRRHGRMMTGTLAPWVPSTRWRRSSSC